MKADFTVGSEVIASVTRTAYETAMDLAKSKGVDRNHALHLMASAIKKHQNAILEANTLDLEASREMAVPELLVDWLKLTPERIQATVQILQRLGELSDPTQPIMNSIYQVDQCQTYTQLVPLGVIALIYESFPELGAIVAGLCLKTGNSVILRGGTEAAHTNGIIAEILQTSLDGAGFSPTCLQLLTTEQGTSTRDLIIQDQYINLVIPYGRPSLVQQVMRQAATPVLKPGIGNCYLYWSASASFDLVRFMILDSHQGEPDRVNAIEKVLLDPTLNHTVLSMLWNSLREKGFVIRGDEELVSEFPDVSLTKTHEWTEPYFKKIVAFKWIDSLDGAIAWMNSHSSGHADCLATESYQESRQFATGIIAAFSYINASPRFYRNPKGGRAIALGISNQKGYRRGLIGLEALTTVKYILQGNG